MWWLPLSIALVMALAIVILHFYQQRQDIDLAYAYRSKYLQVISQLEAVTKVVNVQQELLPKVNNQKVLDYHESSLKILETLLLTMAKVTPFGTDPSILSSAIFLVKDCQKRVERTQEAFKETLRGRSIDLEKLYGREKQKQESGCYFCSRPTISDRFSKVKVKLDGETKEVLSCNVCKIELKKSKKVKVLHLLKDGKTVHWSESEGYVPSEDYWNINKVENKKEVKKLELVVSNIETKLPKKISSKDPENS